MLRGVGRATEEAQPLLVPHGERGCSAAAAARRHMRCMRHSGTHLLYGHFASSVVCGKPRRQTGLIMPTSSFQDSLRPLHSGVWKRPIRGLSTRSTLKEGAGKWRGSSTTLKLQSSGCLDFVFLDVTSSPARWYFDIPTEDPTMLASA